MVNNKPRVIKDFKKIDPELREKVRKAFPFGFNEELVSYRDKNGGKISALPFETEDQFYLLKMSEEPTELIIDADEDTVDLKEETKDEEIVQYGDLSHLADNLPDEANGDV